MGTRPLRRWIDIARAALRNELLAGNLLSLSFLTDPRRMVVYATECAFLYRKFRAHQELPLKNVFEVLPCQDTENIRLTGLNASTWFYHIPPSSVDIVSLCLICQIIRPKTIFEIGTLLGYTARHFVLNSPEDAVVYTLDLPPAEQPTLRLKTTFVDQERIRDYTTLAPAMERSRDGWEQYPAVRRLYGDSAAFDFSPYHQQVDFFFIDGSHSYEYVRSDTRNALECCRSGGVIAWHDYGHVGVNGVTRWLDHLRRQGHDIYNVPGGSLAFMRVP